MANPTNNPGYFTTLVHKVGSGWSNFWFAPSDPIVLSLLRILVGLVALWWYLSFWTELQNWFGPDGLLPYEFARQMRIDALGYERISISLLDLSNSPTNLWVVYVLGLIAIVLMIVGLFSRISTIAAFLFVLSFLHRTPMMARPVDFILAMLMFYLCIGPSGAYFSIDACLRLRRRADPTIPERQDQLLSSSATIAIRLMQVHLALIMFAMALAQLREETWWLGTSVWWMMAKSDSRLVDLTFINRSLNTMGIGQAFEYLVNFFSHLIVFYEFSFAVLIWNSLLRPLLLVLGVFIWLGLALISGAVSFSILMLIATFAFLSPERLHGWFACCGVDHTAKAELAAAA